MKGSRFHLDLLRTFVDVVETASFSQAAARAHLTQSAISQQIAFLEQHFGRQLILRGSRGLKLTEDGQELLVGARKLLEDYQKIKDSLGRSEEEVEGTIRVSAVYSVGLYNIASPMRAFLKSHPGIKLDLNYARFDSIYRSVLAGSLELGIVAYPRRHARLRTIALPPDQLVLACTADHPFSKKSAVAIKDLDGESFVAFSRGMPTRIAIDRILRENGARVRLCREFDNIETIKRSIEAGIGVSILPAATIRLEVEKGTLAAKNLRGGPYPRPIGILLPRNTPPPKAAQRFIRWLQSTKEY